MWKMNFEIENVVVLRIFSPDGRENPFSNCLFRQLLKDLEGEQEIAPKKRILEL